MVMPAVAHSAAGGAEGEAAAVELRPAAVAVLGRLVYDLIKGGEDIVCELHLSYGRTSHGRIADGEASDALLAERRVEDALRPELLAQPDAAAKDPTEGHVLAEDDCGLIREERNAHRVVNSAEEVHALCLLRVLGGGGAAGAGAPSRSAQPTRAQRAPPRRGPEACARRAAHGCAFWGVRRRGGIRVSVRVLGLGFGLGLSPAAKLGVGSRFRVGGWGSRLRP
mmetsp:Transcript_41282/g.129312  ORF Transcript_41282/g.129312 Transcript_41282/m.129312 type:complete len:224 (-) Transcript_41282:71-742(-)